MFVSSSKKADKSLTYSSIVCILYFTDMPKGILSFSSLVYTISKIIINRSVINIFVSYCLTFPCLYFYGLDFQQLNAESRVCLVLILILANYFQNVLKQCTFPIAVDENPLSLISLPVVDIITY